MQQPQLVIFDCDGVLIDSEPLASRTLAETLNTAGIAITAAEAHREFTGKAEADIRRLCVERYGLDDDEAVFAAWHRTLYAAFARELKPMAGMLDLVTGLQTARCVASNSRNERLRASLGTTALWRCFVPHIYGADSVARPKPAPDLLLHCANAVGAQPAGSIMIDDSPHGIAAALAAGMTSIGFVDPNDPRPDRPNVLSSAGAGHIAIGAGQLGSILRALGCVIASDAAPAGERVPVGR